MKNATVISILYFFASLNIFGQISQGGQPYSWQKGLAVNTPKALILKPVSAPKSSISDVPKSGSFTFAELIEFSKSNNEVGTWTTLDSGDKLWQLRLKSEGAYSLNFTFDKYLIPEGAELFVYSPDRKFKLGAFTHLNNKKHGKLAIAAIPGDEIIIEYFEPKKAEFSGELKIGVIGHDYLNAFGLKDGQFGASGTCNIDINCADGDNWQKQKRAVCRIISNNTGLCTGTLVNNSKQDQTPYILTASHCFINNKTPENSVFYFNYESPDCNGDDGSVTQTISGSEHVAMKSKEAGFLDFSLIKLSEQVPESYEPYFAGWDSRTNAPTHSACIHHPWGDVKKISIDNDPAEKESYVGYGYDPQTFWKVLKWDAGMTQGGSSGSALFNQDGRVIGSLSGGDARNCDDEPVNDYYQMFSVAYSKYNADTNQLKAWLDPENTNIEFINGFDPYHKNYELTNLITVQSWEVDQNVQPYTVRDGDGNYAGYLSGNNTYQDQAKAEFFNYSMFAGRNSVIKAYVAFYKASGNDDTSIELQVLNDENGKPGVLLGSAMAKLKDIKLDADKEFTLFKFDPPIVFDNSIYISVVLPQNQGDTVSIMTVDDPTVNTGWELNYYNEWLPYIDDNSWAIKLSHMIALEAGTYTDIKQIALKEEMMIYPNPAKSEIYLHWAKGTDEQIFINLYNTMGRLVLSQQIKTNNGEALVNIDAISPGFYIFTAQHNNQFYTSKFIKE